MLKKELMRSLKNAYLFGLVNKMADNLTSDLKGTFSYSDEFLKSILADVKTIAMVGASPNWNRPSYFAMKYLQSKGYKVFPVNPVALDQKILGEVVYSSLEELPHKVDMVDIFRKSEDAGEITEQAISHGAKVV